MGTAAVGGYMWHVHTCVRGVQRGRIIRVCVLAGMRMNVCARILQESGVYNGQDSPHHVLRRELGHLAPPVPIKHRKESGRRPAGRGGFQL